MTTLRQIRANQMNALKSTGPRTPEGKAISRRNALKHGLAGTGVVLPEDEAAEAVERYQQWHSALRPWTTFEEWLAEQVAVQSVRVERCQRLDRVLRTRRAEEAGDDWDRDRRLAAERLGEAIASAPARVVLELEATRQGAEWLLARWEGLGRALEASGAWDDAQRALAMDLLAVPAAFRSGPTPLDPAPGVDPAERLRALVASRVEALRALKANALDDRDEQDQAAAELGLDPAVDRELALVRRYERSCLRQLEWCRSQIKSGLPLNRPDGPGPRPSPSPSSSTTFPRAADLPGPSWGGASPLSSILHPGPSNRHDRRARSRRARSA